jgi:hypothetical protein
MLFAPTSIRLALWVAAESAQWPTGMNRRAADVGTGETRSGQEASWRGSINSQAREQVRFTLSWTYLASTPTTIVFIEVSIPRRINFADGTLDMAELQVSRSADP